MQELDKFGKIMEILFEYCGDCPLENICKSRDCSFVWAEFFGSKVKEDGVDTCRN